MVLYFHKHPKTEEIFYVGIGERRRAFESGGRNIIWRNYVKKYGGKIVEIVHENITKDEAYKLERMYIEKYGLKKKGGLLVNITLGGEDNPMHHKEIRDKVSLSLIGKKASEETRLKQSIAKKNKPSNQPVGYRHSPEVIERIKAINREITSRPEVKEKLRKFNTGRRIVSKHRAVNMLHPITNAIIKRFDCARDAGILFGKPNTGNIASVCNKKRNFAFGYKWEYSS